MNPEADKTSDPAKEKGDEQLVPLSALEDERRKRQSAERRVAEQEGYARAQAQKPASDAPKELTSAELQLAVDENRMTAADAEAIRDRQIERRVETRVAKRSDAKELANAASAELGRYIQAIPDLADPGSAAFEKVKDEYNYLVGLGYDADDRRTELLAARTAYGDVSKLEKIAQPKDRETHQETGGGREPAADGATRADGWPKEMSADHRRYYEDQINQGALKDRAAALEEITYKPKHRPSHAA